MPVANPTSATLTDLLFEKVDAGLCLVAPDGTVVRANSEWLRSASFTEEQVVGENIIDLFPATRDMALAMHARARAGRCIRVPRRTQLIDGRETYWEGSIAPVSMEGGTGLLITAREVPRELDGSKPCTAWRTKQRIHQLPGEQALAATRLSDEGLRLTLKYVAAGIWELNLASGALIWSPENFELFGVPPAATLDRARWKQCVHPDDLGSAEAAMCDAIAGRTPDYHAEYRVQHPVLGTRWILGAGSVEWGPNGEALYVRGLNVDITDRKRSEQRLRENEALYRSLFTLAPSGVVLNDAEGAIVAFNDKTHQQLGYTREEFERLQLSDIDANEQPEDVRRHIAQIAAAGGDEYEVFHRTKCGETRNVLVRTRPVEIGGEKFFLNVWQDITERKRAEAAIRESDRRKDEFIGMLSHELRNPLAPIRNSVYILQHAGPASEQAQHARSVIERQTEHLTRLVDDLLDVTRIARGKIVMKRSRVDLRDVVRRAADDFWQMLNERGIVFRTSLPDGHVWADADTTRITQVIGNLLHNAAKFTRRGDEVALSLRAAVDHAEIEVRDTGAGIEAALLAHVFDPFVQGQRTLARTDGGLGLGLALVKGITELHGGTVRAASEGKGRGAEFVLCLPTAEFEAAREKPRTVTHGDGQRRRVLVVDDNRDAADTLAQLVEMLGHSAEVVYDGATAIAHVRVYPPDVLLCDVGLPDMSGYDVVKILRASGPQGVRFVALTGYAQAEDVSAALEAGFDRHLAKPTSPEDIELALGS